MSADVAHPFPTENMPLSQPAMYSAASLAPGSSDSNANNSRSNTSGSGFGSASGPGTGTGTGASSFGMRSSLQLPPFITTPIELALGAIGRAAAAATSLLGFSGNVATSRARPWLEFIDLSSFKPADNGFAGYIERLRLNGPYFLFNYIILGLGLSVISVITKPIAIVGVALLIWIYFQFFGAETREGDFVFFGLSLNTAEKIGAMVSLGLIVFWLTAGGLQIFISVITASAVIMLVHGSFRKPSPDALPATSAV